MSRTAISMGKVKDLLNYTIDNNKTLEENGIVPIGIALQADAGIGKTSLVKQVAEERNMGFTKLNIAQLEEVGDLLGMPQVEYEYQVLKLVKDENGNAKVTVMPNTIWLNAKQTNTETSKTIRYRQTGKTRMGYAKPEWVPEYNENGNILLLDDYTRGTNQLTTAMMDLIWEHKYVSWSIPKGTTVVLTTNPDDGNYDVQSQDEAKQTRYMLYDVEFSEDAWAQWAEKAGIDGRCINFVLSYANELFNADGEGNRICNPRSFVMFTHMISGIKDWDNAESQEKIATIAKGCFRDGEGRFAAMFNSFIRNKMHLLIKPKDMLLDSWTKTKDTLEKTLYDGDGKYRPDIASILERRFSNYVCAWLSSDDKTPIAKVKDRILEFMDNEENGGKKLFNKDLFYHMIQTITSDHKSQTNRLLHEPKIAKALA